LQKIALILFGLIFFTSCSVNRIRRTVDLPMAETGNRGKIMESVINQNVTKESFYIQKADIEINAQEGNQKLTGFVKYTRDGLYLISLRSKTGIEAARIFISKDSILVNDRINRRLYCASTSYLSVKYGVSSDIIPLLFGDLVTGKSLNDNVKCVEGKSEFVSFPVESGVKYEIDCKIYKTLKAVSRSNISSDGLEIRYSDFFNKEGQYIPGTIDIKDIKGQTNIKIEIRKIELPWEGEIYFVPGNNYEIIKLK